MSKIEKLTALLCLGLTLAATLAAEHDTRHLSPYRNVEGRYLPREQADRPDHVFRERQNDLLAPPPITLTPICDQFNNYFYVTPQNYTWQLQCTTNYEGTVIQQIETSGYAECIVSCAAYNRANGAGACIAINFNGPDDSSTGLCTHFSAVASSLLAYEEGNVQDSALLVYSPDATVFATPRPAAGFSGQPSQPPTVVPLPASTISKSTVVLFTTSVITITSCRLGVSCSLGPTLQPSPTTSRATTLLPPSPTNPLIRSSTIPATISIIDGGVRPGTTAPSNSVGQQVTFTEVIAYTVYEVQAVALCPPSSGPCTKTTTTGSGSGFRTQLRCSPRLCTGVGVVTNAIADVAAATCIEPA